MATCSVPHLHRDLYNDMKVQFPELPDTVIQSYVQLYPRNREECIQQLTRASQEQLYSQCDPEESCPSRSVLSAHSARIFEQLPPPFPVDQDLPPPYPGALSPVPQSTTQRQAVPLRLSPRATDAPPRYPPFSASPHPDPPRNLPLSVCPWPREYRSQVSNSASPGLMGGSWFPPADGDSSMNRVHHPLSAPDDMTQALLTHQRQRYELLHRTYAQQLELLHQLRREVEGKEAILIRKHLLEISPAHMEELQRLRRENRTLDVECHCLLNEVDLYSRGEVPLGVTDEHFYRRLNPGQSVPVPPSGAAAAQVPAASPRLGTVLSEDEENQDGNRWKCSKCTFLNHPALDKCEVCEMPNVTPGNVTRTSYLGRSAPAACYCHARPQLA